MKFLTTMLGVRCNPDDHMPPWLCRSDDGQLIIVGHDVNIIDVLNWVDVNPLTQFRELAPTTFRESDILPSCPHCCTARGCDRSDPHVRHYQPEVSGTFAHLFNEKGNVL